MRGDWPPLTVADLRRAQAGDVARTPDSGDVLEEMAADAARMDDTVEQTEPDWA